MSGIGLRWMAALLLVALAADAGAEPPLEAARELLARAFANRYAVDFAADIDLVMHGSGGQRRLRTFRALSKVIDDRTHSIGRLVAPSYLRGMTILNIEAADRGHDSFVFLPSLQKVRRVSTAQRRDAFLGSDVTYEDLERRRVEHYTLERARSGELAGEPVVTIGATRGDGGDVDPIEFVVARSDAAILETRDARADGTLYRIVSISRADMRERDGHVLPTRMRVRHLARRSRTDVIFRNLVVGPQIDDRVFSLANLEKNRRLPGEAP